MIIIMIPSLALSIRTILATRPRHGVSPIQPDSLGRSRVPGVTPWTSSGLPPAHQTASQPVFLSAHPSVSSCFTLRTHLPDSAYTRSPHTPANLCPPPPEPSSHLPSRPCTLPYLISRHHVIHVIGRRQWATPPSSARRCIFFSPTNFTFSPTLLLFRQVGSLFRQVGSLFRHKRIF